MPTTKKGRASKMLCFSTMWLQEAWILQWRWFQRDQAHLDLCVCTHILGLPRWLNSKEWAYNVGDRDSIPGSGRFPGEGNGYPLQPSSLKNATDRGAWWATAVHGVTKRLRQDLDQHFPTYLWITCIQNMHFIYMSSNLFLKYQSCDSMATKPFIISW